MQMMGTRNWHISNRLRAIASPCPFLCFQSWIRTRRVDERHNRPVELFCKTHQPQGFL